MHVNNENRWKSRNFRKIRDRSSFSKMANQTENYIDANSTSNNKILPSIQARLKKFKLKIPAAESETIQRNKPTRLKLIKTRGDRISMDEGSMAQIPQSPLVSELTKDSNSNANMKQPRKLSEKLRNFHNMNFRIKGESSEQVSSKQDAGSKDNEIKRLREELISKEKIINGLISDVQFGQFGDSKGIQQKIAKTKESSIVNNLRILCKQMQNELKEKNKQLESLNKSTKVSKLNELSEENRLYISELSKLAKYINSKEKANYDREQLKDIEFNLNDIKDLIPSDGNSDSNQRLMKAVNELETKQTQIESYESELSKLRTENADKDNEIARLENEFEKLLLEVSELEQKVKSNTAVKSEYSHQTEIQYSILPESLPTHESQLPYLKIIEDNDIGKLPEDQVFEVAYLIQKTLEAKQLKSEDLEKLLFTSSENSNTGCKYFNTRDFPYCLASKLINLLSITNQDDVKLLCRYINSCMELYGKSNLSKLDYQYFKLKLLLSLEIGSYSNEDTLRNNIYYKLFPYRQELKDTISAFGGSISIFEFRNCLRNFEEIISDQEIEYLIYRMKWSNRSLRIYNLNSKPFIELLYDDTLIGYPQENSKISPKHSRQDSDINRIIALCEESDCEMTSKKIIYSLKKHLDDGEKEKEFEEFLSNFSFAMKINGKRHITLSLRSLVNFFEKKSILLPNSKELKCFLTAFFVSDKDKAKELLLQLELIDVNKLKSSLLGCNLNPQCSCDSQCSLDTFAELFYGMLHSKSISYEEFIFLSQISIHLAQTRKYFIFDDFVKIITIDWNNDFCCNGLKSSNICFSLIHEGVDCKAVDLEKFKGLLVDLGYCKGENESCNQINNIEANPNKNKEDGIDDDKPETNQGDHIEDEEVLDVNQRDIIHNEQDPAINPLDQNDFKFEGVEFVNNIVRDSLKRYSVDLEKQAKTLSASLCKELLDKATSNFKEEIDEEFINEVLIIGSEMEERANNSCGNERKAPNFANQYDETDNDQGDYTLNDRNALKKAKLPDNTTANPQSDCLKGVNQLRSLSVEDVMQVEVNQEKGLLSIRFKDEDLLKFDNESQCQHLNERASSRFGNISSRSKKETAKVDLASAQKYKRVQTLKGYVPKLNGLD